MMVDERREHTLRIERDELCAILRKAGLKLPEKKLITLDIWDKAGTSQVLCLHWTTMAEDPKPV